MSMRANLPIPQKTDAYIVEQTFLMKDVLLMRFLKGEIRSELKRKNPGLDVSFSEMKRFYTDGDREPWRYAMNLTNLNQSVYGCLEGLRNPYIKTDSGFDNKLKILSRAIEYSLDHETKTRAEAIEIARLISGHLVCPRNKDAIVAVYEQDASKINRGEQIAYEKTPDDFMHFSTKRMNEKQAWDAYYTWRKPRMEITIDPYAISREGNPCCSTHLIINGSHEIKKNGDFSLTDFKNLDLRLTWTNILKLVEVDDKSLTRHVERRMKNAPDQNEVRRRVTSLKRMSRLELEGEDYLSTHNLCVNSGLRLSACKPIDVEPYLPAYAAPW